MCEGGDSVVVGRNAVRRGKTAKISDTGSSDSGFARRISLWRRSRAVHSPGNVDSKARTVER